MSRLLRISGLIAAAAAVFTIGCGKNVQTARPEPTVVVAEALNRNMVISANIIGQAKAFDEVELRARVTGFLVKRLFDEGQFVEKDQLLFEIEDGMYKADLEAANAQLLRSQAQYKNALTELKRNKTLVEKNAVSQREYDNAEFKYMDAKAAVMDAESQVDDAKIKLSYTQIKSPFKGRIGAATYSVGNVVGESSSFLGRVVSIDKMRIQFYVSELQIFDTGYKGQKNFGKDADSISVRIQFQNGTMYDHPGELYFIDNKINASTGTIMIEALFPNDDYIIIPGMYVKVILEKKEAVNTLAIPLQAVIKSQIGSSVLVVNKDGIVEQKLIKTGITNAPFVEVTEGLTAGEYVITEGIQIVKPGLKVNQKVDSAYEAIPAASQTAAATSAPDTGIVSDTAKNK